MHRGWGSISGCLPSPRLAGAEPFSRLCPGDSLQRALAQHQVKCQLQAGSKSAVGHETFKKACLHFKKHLCSLFRVKSLSARSPAPTLEHGAFSSQLAAGWGGNQLGWAQLHSMAWCWAEKLVGVSQAIELCQQWAGPQLGSPVLQQEKGGPAPEYFRGRSLGPILPRHVAGHCASPCSLLPRCCRVYRWPWGSL